MLMGSLRLLRCARCAWAQVEKVQPKASQPAYLEVVDIAGLVKGAAEVRCRCLPACVRAWRLRSPRGGPVLGACLAAASCCAACCAHCCASAAAQ